jgi:hypothetical protein
MTATPDIFSNVHKGIRNALFEACTALGRAGADPDRQHQARSLLGDALHFVAHHGENEDVILLPMLEQPAPDVFARMQRAHAALEESLRALRERSDRDDIEALYHASCAFTALYLEHMREEELELEPLIRRAVSAAELATFAVRAVQRTEPAAAQMMLGWMLPAMTRPAVEETLSKLPPAVAEKLRPLAER